MIGFISCRTIAALIFSLILVIFSSLNRSSSVFTVLGQPESRKLGLRADQQTQALPSPDKRFALLIGVDKYVGDLGSLVGAANDARSLAKSLSDNAGFPKNQVFLLESGQAPDSQPTRANILSQLSNLRSIVPKDGLLLLFFAGHGIEIQGQPYLLPSDTQPGQSRSDLELIADTAISVIRIQQMIREVEIAQVLIIIDACRNIPPTRSCSTCMSSPPIGGRPLGEVITNNLYFKLSNSGIKAFVTLFATEKGKWSYEDPTMKQGYFTLALVEGLNGKAANEKGEVTLAGLVNYVQETVPKLVSQTGRGRDQKPWAVVEGYKANELVIALKVTLIIEADMNCRITFDGKLLGELKNGEHRTIQTNLGQHILEVTSNEGVHQRKETINVYNPGENRITTGLREIADRKSRNQTALEALRRNFVRIPSGEILDWWTNKSRHEPINSFELGKYEVTQAAWEAIMSSNPSGLKHPDLPVVNVSWRGIQEFVSRLNALNDGFRYRIPNAAEWIYAARGGAEVNDNDLVNEAWTDQNAGGKPHLVGMKKPNKWGLYDMYGNVWEMVSEGVARGGSYKGDAGGLISSTGFVFGHEDIGFRLSRTAVRIPANSATPKLTAIRKVPNIRFFTTAESEGILNPTCELKNILFLDGYLYLNGEYDPKENGYRIVCATPKFEYMTFTVAVRFKAEEFTPEKDIIIYGGTSYRWFGIERSSYSGKLAISLNNSDFWQIIEGARLEPGEWTVVACAVNLLERRITAYINGKKFGELALPQDFKLSVLNSESRETDKVWTLTNYSNGNVFHGSIDEIVIFNKILSPDELSKLLIKP